MATSKIEVVTSVERKRRFTASEKVKFVAETYAEGATVASVAKKHGMSQGLLFSWRRALRERRLGEDAALAPAGQDIAPRSPFVRMRPGPIGTDPIRIRFPNGIVIELPVPCEPEHVARIMRALGETP